MVAGGENAVQGDIQSLGGVAGEDDVLGIGASEEGRQLAPGIVNHTGGGQGVAVGAPAGVAHGAHGGHHRINDALGLNQSGGCIV